MRIQHNIMAMNAYRNYNTNTSALSKNLEKLSSGYKINRAGDDAAGLAISEKMRAQITGLEAAQKNVKDGISLVKTAEGAMQEIQDMLNRMDYLATQSANGTYDDEVDRANLQKEVDQLRSEINRIADSANFNGIKLLDGSLATDSASAWSIEAEVSAGADAQLTYDAPTQLKDNFATADATNNGWHAGVGSGEQTDVTFKVDFNGMKATVSTATSDEITVTFKIAGQSISVTAAGSAGELEGDDLAALLDDKEFSIQGVSFTASVTGSEVTFEMSDGVEYDSTAAGNLNDNWNMDIELTGITSNGNAGTTTVSVANGDAIRHTAYDYSGAQAADGADRAGIDFDLSQGDIVNDFNKLTIDGTTFIFKTTEDAEVTAGDGEILVDVSGVAAGDQVAEAVRLMTSSKIPNGDDEQDNPLVAGGDNIKLSAHNGKLHLDQLEDNTNIYDEPEDMHPLITFEKANGGTATAGSVSVDLNKFQLGDRVKVGDDIYVVAGATDEETGDITAADLVTKLKDQITDGVDTSKYTVSVDGTKVTITAKAHGDDDTSDALNALKAKIDTNIKGLAETTAANGGLNLQIGETSDTYNRLKVNVGNMHVYAMGTFETQEINGEDVQVLSDSIADIDISTAEGASKAIDVIKNAINYVSSVRGDLGATQNRLEHTANNLSVMAENIQDAESTIRDTDVAEEMMAYTKNNILVQSAQAMLAQANAVPQGVLQLLG